MNLKELEDFKLTNAIQFHDVLNPVLFRDEHMIPAVRDRLLEIADDFMEHLGVNNIDVKDITLSGSNASYTYTPHSDIDLHILVDIKKLDHDEIYAELFHVKKIIWNLQHDITIGGYQVELYVQDSAQPVVSRGEYSVLNDRWIKFPTKRVADINEPASKSKFEKLVQVAELALKARDMDKIEAVLDTIRKYRKAGLESHGEFSPENIAFKALRTSGLLHRLRDAYNEIHSQTMSMAEKGPKILDKPTLSISDLAKKHGVSREHIIGQLKKGIKVELEHTSIRDVATEIALDHLSEDPNYYTKLVKANLEEGLSGYIPVDKIFSMVKQIHGRKEDFYEGDLSDRIYWFDDYKLERLPVSSINLKQYDVDQNYVKEIMADIQNKKAKIRPIVFDPIGKSIIDGAHRANAYAKLGYKNIPAYVGKTKSETYGERNNDDLYESASGYIPSEAEKDDPRFKTALTVDIKPDSIRQNAIKLGLGKIKRSGIPPIAKPSGKF